MESHSTRKNGAERHNNKNIIINNIMTLRVKYKRSFEEGFRGNSSRSELTVT